MAADHFVEAVRAAITGILISFAAVCQWIVMIRSLRLSLTQFHPS
jgi:hypothetical protein